MFSSRAARSCARRMASKPFHGMSLSSSSIFACSASAMTASLFQVRYCATPPVDTHTAASVVVVDPKQAAKERDRIAREMLTSNYPEQVLSKRTVVRLSDLIHTVPYSLCIALDNVDDATHQVAEMTARKVLAECFEVANNLLNHFNPESEVSEVNQLPLLKKHAMSTHLKKVMECCVEVNRESGGCFDPATGPLVKKLRQAAQNPHARPQDLQITPAEADRFTLHNSFTIDLKEGTIARKHRDAALDLGGVVKGYTVDCVVEGLNAKGFADVLFEWGGDCRASGVNVQRQPWAIGLARPPTLAALMETWAEKASEEGTEGHAAGECNGEKLEGPEEGATDVSSSPQPVFQNGPRKATSTAKTVLDKVPEDGQDVALLRVMPLRWEAVCTSGDYENLISVAALGGALVTSTYDWQTRELLRPSMEDLAQVSVKCYSCMYADALATAALIKKDAGRVRYMMEHYRRDCNRVTDYAAYIRDGERLAHMYEIATESPQRRAERIAGSLPARVLVIGGGLAGQAAAIEAANCGATVILLEKDSTLGGNSAKATSGINAWGTRAQAQQRVHDNCKLFERDTYLSGVGGNCDPGLVRTLSVKSADAIQWLTQYDIPLTVLYQLGGASRKRCHRAPDTKDGTPVPVGYTIMQHLEKHIRTKLQGKVTILTETCVTDLMHESTTLPDGTSEVRVLGVRYKDTSNPRATEMDLFADAVVLATGGFSNDQAANSLLREYAPQLFGTPTTNGMFATGDGVKMARKLGVQLVDMDKVQLHPTGLVDPKDPANRTKYLGPEALRGAGGILLNKSGERFINELDLRSVVSQAIIAQQNEYPGSDGSMFAYCVLNESAAELFGKNSLGYYWNTMGLFTKVENTEELAKLIGCDHDTLCSSLDTYEHLSTEKTTCPLTGKMVYPCVLGPQGPFYVAYVTPSIHYTMGGCLISPSAEILMERHNRDNIFGEPKPILGLLGAGEVTGGVHGGNRLGGNSLLECVVFGKIAGDRAATILQKNKTALCEDKWAPVVVREVRQGDQFGIGSRVLRFNLPGALQTSGLAIGQFIGIRGEWDGQQLIGYYSPITLPDDKGCISVLARGDKGNLREWINSMRPGDSLELKSCGGLKIDMNPVKKQLSYKRTVIRKFGLICGGSGVAPMLQLIRAALNRPYVDTFESVHMVYAAEDEMELTYRKLLSTYTKENPDKFSCHFVLNNPSEGWTGGVGYVGRPTLQKELPPPSKDMLIAICGPPVMQRSVRNDLLALGYSPKLVHTVDEDMIM